MLMKIRMAAVMLVGLLASVAAAQSFTVRPSAFNSGGFTPFVNPAAAYDNNASTAAVGNENAIVKSALTAKEIWTGFPSEPGATGLQLHVTSSVSISGCTALGTGNQCFAQLDYSLNNGSSWQSIYFLEEEAKPKATDLVAFANGTDLTHVQVRAEASAFNVAGTGPVDTNQKIFEIWITGTH
jgi:hypothetical protein